MSLWKYTAGETPPGRNGICPILSSIPIQIEKLDGSHLHYVLPGDGSTVTIPDEHDSAVEHILAGKGFSGGNAALIERSDEA